MSPSPANRAEILRSGVEARALAVALAGSLLVLRQHTMDLRLSSALLRERARDVRDDRRR